MHARLWGRKSTMRPIAAALAAALLAAAATAVSAQTPTQVKAAHMATQHARSFIFQLQGRNGYAIPGTVSLYPIGTTRTRVTVNLSHAVRPYMAFSLVRGTDCEDNRTASAITPIPLNAFQSGQSSQTIVSLPITALQGNYVVEARNTANAQRALEACARLNRAAVP